MDSIFKSRRAVALLLATLLAIPAAAEEPTTLLNVSYDVTREFYKEYNAAFIAHWQQTAGQALAALWNLTSVEPPESTAATPG